MSKLALGRLEPVDLRAYWAREDTEFTPWLSEPANLALLGEAVGMELECLGTEEGVGPFRADVLCRDLDSGSLVLVENQLESTDHKHLGQLITYAAGLDTVHIVWVAQSFSEPHRAALDWLNEITMEDFAFFGVQVELWRIGGSPPAPRFHVVAKPNEWTKSVRTERNKATGERAEVYRGFWTEFLRYLEDYHPGVERPKATGMQWIPFRGPHHGCTISYAPNANTMSAYVWLDDEDRNAFTEHAWSDPDAFEKDVGVAFEWKPNKRGQLYGKATREVTREESELRTQAFAAYGAMLERLPEAVEKRYVAWKAS